jgi:hypothetical protein
MAQYSLSGVLLAALLVELFLLVSWNRSYFSRGLPIYAKRIAVPFVPGTERLAGALERSTARRGWNSLKFKALSESECAFRESLVPPIFHVPYVPLMRGYILRDGKHGEVVVRGLCNWYAISGLAFVFLPVIAIDIVALAPIAVLFGGSYIAQISRFNQVCAAIQGPTLPPNNALEQSREG